MPIPCPPVIVATREDVAERTEALAKAFSKEEWRAPEDGGMDAGRALIQVFSRMAQHVIDRVNRVPDRSFAAFLDRVGVTPAPPSAARVPLTFSLVERGDAEPVVPAGTRVGAEAAPGDTREVVFETEIDLPTTRARLVSAFVRQPDGDRIADRTDAATGLAPGLWEAFDGGTPAEHALYLASDDVLGLAAGTEVEVRLAFAGAAAAAAWDALHASSRPELTSDAYYLHYFPDPPLVEWTYWNGEVWAPLGAVVSGGGSETAREMRLSIPADLAPVAVGGREARWIRARLRAWPRAGVPEVQHIRVSAAVSRHRLAPDVACSAGRELDLSTDFHPFGERPRLNDRIYLACAEALARPGARVTVHFTRSAAAEPLKATDRPVLAWEVSTASGWTKVVTDTVLTGPANELPETSFTVPLDVAPAAAEGKTACWLRIRLAGGGYGKGFVVPVTDNPQDLRVTNDGYRPPILSGVALSCDYEVVDDAPLIALRSDRTLTERGGAAPFQPFVRSAETEPALYLGFDRPFTPGDALLYLQVAPLTAADAAGDTGSGSGSRVAWEIACADGWIPLACQDETRGFLASGLLRFFAPSTAAPRAERGEALWWIRARLLPPGGESRGPTVQPRLGRVLTNTVWASDASVIKDETLGSGDGQAGQSFSFARRPVLTGQIIEVREPAVPSSAERAEIERLEGLDAVTVIGDPTRPEQVWVRWHEVPDFLASGPRDRHYVIDRLAGRVRFGDGQRGMPPPRAAAGVRAARYRTGGGADGNRPAGALTQLKSGIPYVEGVNNLQPATAGADREPPARVMERGPRALRHGQRAVTAEDIEDLAREASPAVARARAITPRFDAIKLADVQPEIPEVTPGAPAPGGVVVLIATSGPDLPPTPSMGLLRDVEAHLRTRVAPAVALRVAGPAWVEVRVERLTVEASSAEGLELLRARVEAALTAFLHPITGGMDGQGWDFGRLPYPSDIYRLVMSIPGVARVGALTLGWSPTPPSPDEPSAARLLIYPGAHRITVSARRGI